MRRPLHLEVLFCLSLGVFLAADDPGVSTLAFCSFVLNFTLWLGRMRQIASGE